MKAGWSRKSYVTRCADPTQVVEWTKDGITITEFQGIYQVNAATHRTLGVLAKDLHEMLEGEYERDMALEAENYDGDPDCNIYGEA